ncbi:hypothetical protein [Sphaerisporangium sp. NPDC051011]|uniref:hypothetical protein n=1 Tax=Sphaerisporangium sp. NPDC051011 TaxID=3155792 RepID=UPI0033E184FB
MTMFDGYVDEFCWTARQQLEHDLESSGYGSLLAISTSHDGIGLWASATVSLPGQDEPWEFHRLILRQNELASHAVPGHGEVEATVFTALLMEVLATRPWPPADSMSASPAKPSSIPSGAVEAWPGGPHLRSLVPGSLRARHVGYIRELHAATWAPLRQAITRDPWIGLKPEFLEDPQGVWLHMSMRREDDGVRTYWRYRELVIPPEGPAEPAAVVGHCYVDRAISDFQGRWPLTP